MKLSNISNYTGLLNKIKEECLQNPKRIGSLVGQPLNDYKSILNELSEDYKQEHAKDTHVQYCNRRFYKRCSLIGELETKIKKDLNCRGVLSSGVFFYGKGGYCGWHTDNRKDTKKLYFAFANEANKSFFATYKDDLIVDYDVKGWQSRMFKTPMWHSVGSNCLRFSLGFNVRN